MFTPITIVGQLVNPDGSPATGGWQFQLTNTTGTPTGMTDSSTGELVAPIPIQAQWLGGVLLATSGQNNGPLILLANDDSTTRPTGLVYTVTEQLAVNAAYQLAPWQLTVHAASPGGTLNVSTQRPTP